MLPFKLLPNLREPGMKICVEVSNWLDIVHWNSYTVLIDCTSYGYQQTLAIGNWIGYSDLRPYISDIAIRGFDGALDLSKRHSDTVWDPVRGIAPVRGPSPAGDGPFKCPSPSGSQKQILRGLCSASQRPESCSRWGVAASWSLSRDTFFWLLVGFIM